VSGLSQAMHSTFGATPSRPHRALVCHSSWSTIEPSD
jgi:hypothetical protein